jgi:hypothetical protein
LWGAEREKKKKIIRKKAQKLKNKGEGRGEKDEGHTSSPRGTHKEVVKHHKGCCGKTTRILVRAFRRRKMQEMIVKW